MIDTFTPEIRSIIMRNIRSTSTNPERSVIRLAKIIRPYFQVNSLRLPGKPDIAFFKLKRAIFVHGCFWHQHIVCKRSNMPKSNLLYWGPKLARNVQRDREVKAELHRMGWRTLTIWECQCYNTALVKKRLIKFLSIGVIKKDFMH